MEYWFYQGRKSSRLSIVFFILITWSFQFSGHAISRWQQRTKSKLASKDYLQQSYNKYTYPSCQKYDEKEDNNSSSSYLAYCSKEQVQYLPLSDQNLGNLSLPANILRKKELETNLLKTIQSQIKSKMAAQFNHLKIQYECLQMAQNSTKLSKQCQNIVNGFLKSTDAYLPQMRQSLAVMQTDYTRIEGLGRGFMPTGYLSRLEIETDIEHPNFDEEISPLTQKEHDSLLQKRKKQREKFKAEFFSHEEGDNKKCQAPKARSNAICKYTVIPKLNQYIKGKENKIIDQSKEYYEKVISQYPFLPYIKQGKLPIKKKAKLLAIKDAVKKLYQQAEDQYNNWKDKPLEEYRSFFHYPNLIENLLKNKVENNKLQCDIMEGLNERYGPGGSDELYRNIGIALGTLAGGGLCVFTGGLACALGVAIVGEALTLGHDQQQLSLTRDLYRTQLVDSNAVQEDKSQRNISLAMAPLSFVGLKGGNVIRSGTKALSSEAHAVEEVATNKSAIKGSEKLLDDSATLTKSHLDELLTYQATSPAQNKKWIEMAKEGSKGKALFFDVENAAMKKLNDRLGDKNLVTSLTNLHKTMLQKEFGQWAKKYPGLDISLYSDFKSLRFALKGDLTPELRTKLKSEFAAITKDVNEQFADKVASLRPGVPSTIDSPQTWFKAGIGDTADQAGLAARKSRNSRDISAVDIDTIRPRIQTQLKGIEELRLKVSKDLPVDLVDSKNGIPHMDVIEYVRKKGDLFKEDPATFQKNFQKRFNHNLSEEQLGDLVGYLKQIDQFSPGLWLEKRVVANLDAAKNGGFSADFKGMGAKNLQQVAIDLSKNPNSMDKTLDTLRAGEGIVTKGFDKNKNWYTEVVTKTLKEDGIKTKNLCSGDDCVSIPTQAIPDLTKEKIMRAIAKNSAPDGQRLSFIPPGIAPEQRTLLAVHGELIEKQVRNQLTGFTDGQLPPDVLKKVAFAIDMPKQVGSGAPRLMISTSPGFTLSATEKSIIQKAYSGLMQKVNKDIAEETGKKTLYNSGDIIWVTQ